MNHKNNTRDTTEQLEEHLVTKHSHCSWSSMLQGMHAQSLQSCPTLCGPTHYSLPDSSVQGISQARILKWVAISLSKGFSPPTVYSGPSKSIIFMPVDSTKCRSKYSEKEFQKVPKSKTWICCSTSNYLHNSYIIFTTIYRAFTLY